MTNEDMALVASRVGLLESKVARATESLRVGVQVSVAFIALAVVASSAVLLLHRTTLNLWFSIGGPVLTSIFTLSVVAEFLLGRTTYLVDSELRRGMTRLRGWLATFLLGLLGSLIATTIAS